MRWASRNRASFQPTYEELKHLDPAVHIVRHAGFQPTYEELKLPALAVVVVDRLAFPAYL